VGLLNELAPPKQEGIFASYLATLQQITELTQALLRVPATLAAGGNHHRASAEPAEIADMEDAARPRRLSLPLRFRFDQTGHRCLSSARNRISSSRGSEGLHGGNSRAPNARGPVLGSAATGGAWEQSSALATAQAHPSSVAGSWTPVVFGRP